jgi:hypothetical protein
MEKTKLRTIRRKFSQNYLQLRRFLGYQNAALLQRLNSERHRSFFNIVTKAVACYDLRPEYKRA